MNIDNIIPSTLKVTASENLNVENDLTKAESTKTLEQLINEENQKDQDENDR
jgi:hypothetical protein